MMKNSYIDTEVFKMIPYQRQSIIIEELEKKDIIFIEDLVKIFENVSESTIRRDLKNLEEEGQIHMLRGGGVKLKLSSYDIPVGEKQFLFKEEKERIARLAASLVKNDEVIYIDSSTTCLAMIKYLNDKNITVITTNIQVLTEIDNHSINCIIVGGEVNKTLDSVAGPLTDENLGKLYFDKSFLGTSGYSLKNGINTPDFREASKKMIVKNNSKDCYVLADSSKANKNTLCKAFDLNECIIITDMANEVLQKHARFLIAGNE
jgi:DeoR family transcriptional regulator, fructose operon transcriptional repressor